MTRRQKQTLARIVLGAALFAVSLFLDGRWQAGFALAAWLLAGYDVLWSAVRNILRGQIFDEKFLMTLATVCAIAMQDWKEAAAVMIFFQVGELFEQFAVERSRRSIADLMDLRPDYATVLRGGEEVRSEPEDVAVGDILLVRAGERIAVDGTVVEGESALDTSKITGESAPAEVRAGSAVVSGSVNLSGVLKIRAESAYEQSTVARILTLVESAAEEKAQSERLITKFARYYTPSVIAAAVLLAVLPPLILAQPFAKWLTRALTFLVISCPCALVISVPLSFFSGMGAAAKLGVIVKGGAALEQLAKTSTMVFDKTGTLTKGEFSVQSIECARGSETELLQLAALCEQYSNHPVARKIRESCPEVKGHAEDIREHSGYGITARVGSHAVAVGNRRLMERFGVEVPETAAVGTVVYVAADNAYLGAIIVGDRPRENVRETMRALHAAGVKKTVMLTGDREAAARECAKRCGLREYRAQLLPQDKVEAVQELLRTRPASEAVAFVGDGVNDAPVLTAADVGIAMGGVGSDAAVEAADAVLLNDEIGKLPALLKIARRTCAIAKQNIAFALTVKGICLILGALGYAPMWLAIFADVGVAVLAILNAFRALQAEKA